MSSKKETQSLIEIWRTNIRDKSNSWVLFKHGTCVIVQEPITDIKQQAIELLIKWGPVVPGTNLGDFTVKQADDNIGWLIVYTYPDIANYVHPNELPEDLSSNNSVTIGLIGREKRKSDAESLKIIHIERVR